MSNMAHHPALLSRLRVTVAGQTREFADAVVPLGRDTALPVVVVHPDVSRPARGVPPRRRWLVPRGPAVDQRHLPRRAPGQPRTAPRGPARAGPARRHRRGARAGRGAGRARCAATPGSAAGVPRTRSSRRTSRPRRSSSAGPAGPPPPATGRSDACVRHPGVRPARPRNPQPGPTPYVEPATVAAYGGPAGRHRQHARAAAAPGSPRARPHGDPLEQPDGPEPLDRPVADLRHRPRRPAGLPAARDAERPVRRRTSATSTASTAPSSTAAGSVAAPG